MTVDSVIKIKDKSHGGLSFNGSAANALFVVKQLRSLADIDENDFLTKFLWALEIELQSHGILDNEFNEIDQDADVI